MKARCVLHLHLWKHIQQAKPPRFTCVTLRMLYNHVPVTPIYVAFSLKAVLSLEVAGL